MSQKLKPKFFTTMKNYSNTNWNENYNLYINESIGFISIMWRINSTVRNAKLIITPQDRNRAPVTITFTAYQK